MVVLIHPYMHTSTEIYMYICVCSWEKKEHVGMYVLIIYIYISIYIRLITLGTSWASRLLTLYPPPVPLCPWLLEPATTLGICCSKLGVTTDGLRTVKAGATSAMVTRDDEGHF
jgi:hypothetical protein